MAMAMAMAMASPGSGRCSSQSDPAAGLLIGLGVPIVVDAVRNSRGHSIAVYNQAVGEWESAGRARLAAAVFRAAGPAAADVELSTASEERGGADGARIRAGDGDAEIRTSYLTARKQAPLAQLLSPGPKPLRVEGGCIEPAACTLSVSGPAGELFPPFAFRPTRFDEIARDSLTWDDDTGDGTVVKRPCEHDGAADAPRSCASICAASRALGPGFEYRPALGRCLRSQRVATVCLQVSPDGSGGFAAASARPCFGSTIETWARIEALAPAEWAPLGSETLEVRSSEDPLVVADRLTRHEYFFGLTALELGRKGGLMILSGVLLFALGQAFGGAGLLYHAARQTRSSSGYYWRRLARRMQREQEQPPPSRSLLDRLLGRRPAGEQPAPARPPLWERIAQARAPRPPLGRDREQPPGPAGAADPEQGPAELGSIRVIVAPAFPKRDCNVL